VEELPLMGPHRGVTPTRALQKIYEIARRAAREEKYRQLLDDETGEPLGEYRNLEEAFEKVRTFFGLQEPR
jgi:hypothetical protein